MFDAMPILTAKNAFDYARISKIVLSGKNIVRFLAPLVVFEDNHLLVIFKPAGILSQSDKTGDLSVNEIFAAYLKEKYQKPGRVFCAAVQRLDRPASGLMALARTSKAAARLSEEIRATRFKKRYRVFTEKKLIGGPRAVLTAAMEKQSTKSGFKATLQTQNNSSLYVVSTRLVRSQHGVHEYDVSIDTGKFHQIRAIFAAHGSPLLGDVKYGGKSLAAHKDRIALVASSIEFSHPTLKKPCLFYLESKTERALISYFV